MWRLSRENLTAHRLQRLMAPESMIGIYPEARWAFLARRARATLRTITMPHGSDARIDLGPDTRSRGRGAGQGQDVPWDLKPYFALSDCRTSRRVGSDRFGVLDAVDAAGVEAGEVVLAAKLSYLASTTRDEPLQFASETRTA